MIYLDEEFESADGEAFNQVHEAELYRIETLFLKRVDERRIGVRNVHVAKIYVVGDETRSDVVVMDIIQEGFEYHGILSLSRTYHNVGTHAVANMMLFDGWDFCEAHEYVSVIKNAQKDLEQWV